MTKNNNTLKPHIQVHVHHNFIDQKQIVAWKPYLQWIGEHGIFLPPTQCILG